VTHARALLGSVTAMCTDSYWPVAPRPGDDGDETPRLYRVATAGPASIGTSVGSGQLRAAPFATGEREILQVTAILRSLVNPNTGMLAVPTDTLPRRCHPR
jgi:hypothetical protein